MLKVPDGESLGAKHFHNKIPFFKVIDNIKAILQEYLPQEKNVQDKNINNSNSVTDAEMNSSSRDPNPKHGPIFFEHR